MATPINGTCGRPTNKGTPCVKGVSTVYLKTCPTFIAEACGQHLTTAEQAAIAVMRAEDDARLDRIPPACHAWPAPVDVELDDWEKDYIQERAELRTSILLAAKMSTWQGDRCAVCGRPGANVEDHCHRTGLFRGYLCRRCNTREGLSGMPFFEKYRLRPPAVICGYTYRYIGYGTPDDGAEPQDWVMAALGPVPPDHTPEVVEYLAAAARLPRPVAQVVNLGW